MIHADFQRGFVEAEILGFDGLVTAGSMLESNAAGKARREGEEYGMQGGDVVEFRFNV